ncbi:MAG: trigger factor [Leptospirales bacterium]
MDLKIEPDEGAKRKFQVIYTGDEVRTRVDRMVREALKDVKVPGYRTGHVPASYARSRPPLMASVHEDVTRNIHTEIIETLVKKSDEVVVFLDPEEFSLTPEHEKTGLSLSGILEVFSLPQGFVYEKIALSPESLPSVAKDEIEKAIDFLSRRGATQFVTDLPPDTAAEESDVVDFTFSFIDPATGLSRDGRQTITVGDPSVPEILTRSLIGKKAGESFSGKIPFNIPGEKKGSPGRTETLEATIGIHSVRRMKPLTREELLSTMLGGKEPAAGETLESLVEKRVLEQKVTEVLHRKMEELVVEVLSRNAIPVPEGRIDLEIDRMKRGGIPETEIDRERVKRDTIWWFILDSLSEKIQVSPGIQRVEQEFFSLVQRAGSPGKDDAKRNEYIEQAMISARRRLTEEYLLRKSTFSGWEDIFGDKGLLETLGWNFFGVLPSPEEQAGHDHDHDHDHKGHSH